MTKSFFVVVLIFFSSQLSAQNFFKNAFNTDVDKTYYDEFKNTLTLRAFTANKSSSFSIDDNSLGHGLDYKSNPITSLGLGFSYRMISMNLDYGFSFFNKDRDGFGKTEKFDFFTQINLRKFTVNFFSSSNSGFYIENPLVVLKKWNPNLDYVRADVREKSTGLSVNYIFNSGRYSNKSTFLQSEWQKKSAGSLLAGGNVFFNEFTADSSIIPMLVNNVDFFRGVRYTKSTCAAFGVSLGYAYNYIIKKYWFINAALNIGLSSGKTTLNKVNKTSASAYKWSATWLINFGIGYNSEFLFVGANYSGFNATSPTPINNTSIGFNNIRLQLVVAYRFKIRNNLRILPHWVPLDL